MLPPELLKWADVPTIMLVIFMSQVLRPLFDRMAWFAEVPDRIIVVPLVLGLLIGFGVECSTPTFEWSMVLRRVLIDAFGAAGMFKAGKTLFTQPE